MVATFVASTAVLFAVTFRGPPPMAAPQTVANIATALRDGRSPHGLRPAIDVYIDDDAPRAFPMEQRMPGVELEIAQALKTDRANVIALGEPPMMGSEGAEIRGRFQIGWRIGDDWRIAHLAPRPFLRSWHKVTLVWMGIALLVLLLPAWWLAAAISLPIERLATAADGVRAGAPLALLATGGPGEIRTLNRAVTAMHDRLARHAEQRTGMLAAIAHDLGTPLSRLSFWVEQLPAPAHDRAVADIDEMRAMIADTLDFARGEVGERDRMRVDLGSLLDSLVEDMRVGGQSFAFEAGPRAIVRGDPRGLRRLFTNLVGNAIRYGEQASLRWSLVAGTVVVLVEDEGPGIDPAMAERLFEPFVRGDPSRNRATGGTGLGLAIVRAIAGHHGGDVTLANRPTGGAVARVVLPLVG
ncbi:MAG: sensor histidine kinase [Janthinobacterium lividum]